MQQLRYIRKQGAEIASVIDDLAQLRIAVFYDFPYLYEGTIDYERIYLQTYVKAEKAFLFAVYDGDKMVGATTCIPLSNETPEVQEPFVNAGLDVDSIFYFGESILLAAYRGHGLGHRFFDEREAHAASFGTFKQTCFCAVDRGESHPLQPIDYRPNDAFWLKRGYEKTPSLQCSMEWLDRGETQATSKPMIFWTKSLV